MAEHIVDQSTWPRSAQFRFYKTFERPHYAVTARVDASHVMARKAKGVSVNRACLFAIGCGLHAAPELTMRFRGDTVVRHDSVSLSVTVPRSAGDFNYAYVPFVPSFEAFDTIARDRIAKAQNSATLDAHSSDLSDDVAYLSCLPWLDFTAIDNAMPNACDCIPRVAWGKIVPTGKRFDMALSIQVHHALVDGSHLGAFFKATQSALDML